jgi:hypothetical protein
VKRPRPTFGISMRFRFRDGSAFDKPIEEVIEARERQIRAFLEAMDDSLREERAKHARPGRKKKVLERTQELRETWLDEAFRRAYDELEAEGSRRIGHQRLRTRTRRAFSLDDARRKEITDRRARDYVKARQRAQ